MPETYEVLAPIYDWIGMAEFAQRVTPRLINFAQQNDWLGRRILDLGCGTGGSAVGLCNSGFGVSGVDSSAEMLRIAEGKLDEKARGLFRAYQQDIAALENMGQVDMVLALDIMNEMDSLRELEKVFTSAKLVLQSGKIFIFDLHTIEGLTKRGQSGDAMIQDKEGGLFVMMRDQYDYDRQIHTRRYNVFTRQQGDLWKQEETTRVLRSYPVQAVATLLQRSGFSIMRVFDGEFETFEPGVSSAARVIFVAQKQ
jgi:SAM-dependent methyltransferase